MIFNSIRWRVQAWHGLILVVVLSGFGVTTYKFAEDNQIRSIDQELERQSEDLLRPRPEDGPPPGPPPDPSQFRDRARRLVEGGAVAGGAVYFVLWQRDGRLLAHSPGTPPDVPVPGLQGGGRGPRDAWEGRTRGDVREVLRRAPEGDTLLAGRSIVEDRAAMRRLALWFVAAGAGILLLGLAGGSWLASRAIRPIDEISATAQRIAAGDLSQRIDVADTESELGRLAAVLNSTFARLEAAFLQQARFTADASHELRTPVAVILSQTQSTLAREREAPEYREALEACQRAAQRMRKLTEALLELARLDAGQEPMQQERFDLGRVVRECAELVRPLATECGVVIDCNLAATECLGDSRHISQLATNLVSNAIHHNRPGGQVHLSTHREGDSAILTVADTGYGIEAEHIPHIFERFYRVDSSRSGGPGHSGLGLAICKAIAEAHGGAISVSSQPGSGSSFRVRLAAAPKV